MTIFLAIVSLILLYGLIMFMFYGCFHLCRSSIISSLSSEIDDIKLNEIQADAYFHRGNLFHNNSFFEKAVDNYNKAMNLSSSHPLAEKYYKYASIKKIMPSINFEKDQEGEVNEQDIYSPLSTALSKNGSFPVTDFHLEEQQVVEINEIDPPNSPINIEEIRNSASDESYIELSVEKNKDIPTEPPSLEVPFVLNMSELAAADQSTDGTAPLGTTPPLSVNQEVAKNKDNGLTSFQLGQTLHQQGILADAILEYDKAININPEHLDAYLHRAAALLKSNRIDDALIDYNKVIELEPKHVKAHVKRGNIFLHKSKLSESIDDYSVAIEFSPNSSKYFVRRGTALFRIEMYEESIDDFSKAITLDPVNQEAYKSRGMAQKKVGNNDQAKLDFLKVESLKKDTKKDIVSDKHTKKGDINCPLTQELEEVFEQGMMDLNKNNKPEALASFNQVIQRVPTHADSYYHRANIHFSNNNFDKAILDYSKAIEINSTFGDAYCKRGQANIQNNLYIDAVADFDKAIEILPDSIEAFLNRGKANSQRAQRDKAISDFTKVLEIDCTNNTALYLRGVEWQNLGEYDKALKDLDNACNLGNNAACVAYLNMQDGE